jgi:hypothetical protein
MVNFKHPKDVAMKYWGHLKVSWVEVPKLLLMALIMLVHGILPFLLDKRFSSYITKTYERLDSQGVLRDA